MSQGVLKHGKEAVDGSSAKGYDMIIAAQAELRVSTRYEFLSRWLGRFCQSLFYSDGISFV